MSEPHDVDGLRADTPGCAHVNHLNNAGAALSPRIVTDTVVAHLRREEEIGGYEAHDEAASRIDAVPDSIATLVGVRRDQIAIVESATEGWARGLQAVDFTRPLGPDDRMLVSAAEYASNVLPLMQLARHRGARLEFIPDDESGCVDVSALARMLDDDVAVVAINHCPSQNGLVNDVTAIGEVLQGSRAWYLVDACQSVGQLLVDASAIRADVLSATGRKWLRGPRGSGFVVLSDRALNELEPFPLDLHSATWLSDGYAVQEGARRFEYWERSYAAMLGLGAAVDYALACGIDVLAARIALLARRARSGLAELPGVTVRDRGSRRSGIVTFSHDSLPADTLVAAIRAAGIHVSLSTPDYSRRDFDSQQLAGAVRMSPHAYNTEAEVDALLEVVAAALAATLLRP